MERLEVELERGDGLTSLASCRLTDVAVSVAVGVGEERREAGDCDVVGVEAEFLGGQPAGGFGSELDGHRQCTVNVVDCGQVSD